MQRLGKSLRSRSKRSALKLSYFSLVCVSEQLGPQPLERSLVLARASEGTPAIIGSSICSQLHNMKETVSEKSSLLNRSFASGVSCETIRSQYRRSCRATSSPRHVIQVLPCKHQRNSLIVITLHPFLQLTQVVPVQLCNCCLSKSVFKENLTFSCSAWSPSTHR